LCDLYAKIIISIASYPFNAKPGLGNRKHGENSHSPIQATKRNLRNSNPYQTTPPKNKKILEIPKNGKAKGDYSLAPTKSREEYWPEEGKGRPFRR
jgi:hypothetical protein